MSKRIYSKIYRSISSDYKQNLNMINKPENLNMISVHINAESIYEYSLIDMKLTSDKKFSVKISGKIVSIQAGDWKSNDSSIKAIQNGGIFEVNVELLNWFVERKVFENEEKGPENQYGMRYYPFVSSILKGSIIPSSNSIIKSIVIELPDEFRLIWYSYKVLNSENRNSERDHSYGAERSKYIFTWKENDNSSNGKYLFNVPIRAGGVKLLKIIEFPILYGILALIGIALASYADKSSVLIAAIAGVLTFLLRQWGSTKLPQRITILTHIYIIAAIVFIIWGISWGLVSHWALILAIPIVWAVYRLWQGALLFSNEGKLPLFVETYWYDQVKRIDKVQKERGINVDK